MRMSEHTDKIAPALHRAQAEMYKVAKSNENTYDRYKYATLEDYYNACRRAMNNNDLFVMESVEGREEIVGRITKKQEPQYACCVCIDLAIIHTSGQWVKIKSVGEGQDRADKGTYKAITGARKYAIAMAMNLVTSDDPEADEGVGLSSVDKAGRQRASSPPNFQRELVDI